MNTDDEWDFVQEERNAGLADAGSGILRITLLFGSAALAIAMFIVPLMNRTGSVDYASARNMLVSIRWRLDLSQPLVNMLFAIAYCSVHQPRFVSLKATARAMVIANILVIDNPRPRILTPLTFAR